MKKLLYFGCIREKGHYLFSGDSPGCNIANRSSLERLVGIAGVTDSFLHTIDGTYVPFDTRQGAYKVSTVPPFLIVAWNDYTIDTRPGSNSVFLGIGYASDVEMINDAINHFPSVMKRQTVPLFPVA